MSYCEKTDHNEYALHLNKTDVNEVIQALKKRKSKDAFKLQKIISCEISGNKKSFLKNREIELCLHCGGSGKVRVNITGTYDFDFETCPNCEGKTGRVKITTTTYEPLTELWQEHFTK